LLAAFADDADGGWVEVEVGEVEDGNLGPAAARQVGEGDDGGIAGTGWSWVGGAHRQQGVELVMFDIAAGRESAAGHRSEVDGSEVVVGGQRAEAPGRLEGASEGGDVLVGGGPGRSGRR
jgi:hypothetical protein